MASNARNRESALLAALAAELRAEAAKQQIKIHELARRSGMPYPTVQKSLAGKRMIDVYEIGQLCFALNISPAELFTRVEAWVLAAETPEEEEDTKPHSRRHRSGYG